MSASAAALKLDNAFTPQAQEYEMSSGSRYTAAELKYIYIFYRPFDAGLNTESLTLDAKTISTEPAWNCRLYLAVQEGTATGSLSFRVEMDSGLTSEQKEARLRVLSAGGLKNDGIDYTMDLVPSRPAEDKMYRVKVQVMEAGTGDVVAEAETTIYHE